MKRALISGLMIGFFALPSVAEAQTSIACEYMLLRVYHAELDHCRVSLPKEREDRYQRMRSAMEKFIRANAKNDAEKMIAGIADNEKRAIAGLSSCQSEDFKLARQAIDQLTDFSNEKTVTETLKVPRDPQRGSCGS
jgi:hypothetical protein